MIADDQPTCFSEGASVRVSSLDDGSMLARGRVSPAEAARNRHDFATTNFENATGFVRQVILYDELQSFDRIEIALNTSGEVDCHADMLITDVPGRVLLLPVADCVATVMYDDVLGTLALLHLGRHSTVANLARKGADYFLSYGSQPENITVWMSPSIKQASYVLEYFSPADDPAWRDYAQPAEGGFAIDLAGYNRQGFIGAGIPEENIIISPIDTAQSADYPSHYCGDSERRFAVAAMIRA